MSLQFSTTAPSSSLYGLTWVTNDDVVQAAPYIVLVSTQSCLQSPPSLVCCICSCTKCQVHTTQIVTMQFYNVTLSSIQFDVIRYRQLAVL